MTSKPADEVYREAVKRLTKENRELRNALDVAVSTHRNEVRALKAQLREGLSAELAALQAVAERERRRADAAARALRAHREGVRA